ncbi:hypothetical protein K466DRAFT_592841 [Polyporus arcularius HHB13444]|uniref:Uncharacterized protein n=1 Tax=Polyporus arcularius HHB13444 TaxID=1314778 RepID=A0A5C3NNV1_9APHY|nr:hypothetical protein K466DRAFT_592841 [Polyporus arcularius HHB13444]
MVHAVRRAQSGISLSNYPYPFVLPTTAITLGLLVRRACLKYKHYLRRHIASLLVLTLAST